jgi:uncharacterized damage-inducible protein DinB
MGGSTGSTGNGVARHDAPHIANESAAMMDRPRCGGKAARDTRRGETMTEPERMATQLRRAFEGEAWHGPSVLEALEGVDAARAAARPIAAAHSIWEIVQHLTTWDDVVRRRLQGENVPSDAVEDWQEVGDASESRWRECLARLRRGNETLQATVAALGPASLDVPAVPGGSTRYVLTHGQIQHLLYHAGQIVLLKKASSPA